MNPEPVFDLAHLAHVELLTPKLEQSRRFFVDVMGMVESDRGGDSVYLRGWDDYEHHSLQLIAAKPSCAPPISALNMAYLSRQARINLPSNSLFSSMFTNRGATASRLPMQGRA